MRLSLKINESSREIQNRILQALSIDLNNHISRAMPNIEQYFKIKINDIIVNSHTSWFLSNGQLKADFGLDFDPVPAIAQAVADSVKVNFKRLDKRLKGGIEITVQPLDYLNLLSLPESVVITEKGAQLPWLDWLLTYGNSVIIVNFGVLYQQGLGRSGMGIMVQGNRPFTIDPFFAGTKDDNWITRAIDLEIQNLEIGLAMMLS